jgi:tRNA-2-methylthio-N6-dimethylallyladenosine synthase
MKYHVWTEGCQMNVADSRRVASALERLGYEHAQRAEEADVILLNTCVVRQSAEERAYGRLSSLKPLKKKNPELIIGVMGCLYGVKGNQALKDRFPYVDVFSSPSDIRPIISLLSEREEQREIDADTTVRFAWMDGEISLPEYERGQLVSAFLPVMDGCSHACAYCIIPNRRGAEHSRPPEDILREARVLVEQGVKEITLLGQIVDRYGLDQAGYPTLAELLEQLHRIENLERIRFLTSHPNWMTDELLDCVSGLERVMPHIEVPMQAGDDTVLENMRRGYTADDYRQLVARIRSCIPGVSIANDVIVGFPGETEEQFQHTHDLVVELKLDVLHLARYSPRKGTLSERKMEDDVPEEEKWRRFRKIEGLQKEIASEIHSKYLGKMTPVLFEEKVKKRWKGRTPTNKLVFVETDQVLRGQLLPVEITWVGPWSMVGKVPDEAWTTHLTS